MRATWTALYASLHSSLTRRSAERLYQAMRKEVSDLVPHRRIADLLIHQGRAEGDPAERYRMIRHLVAAAQSGAGYAQVAHTIILVALWPGLDAAYHRLWHKYPKARPDLASDLLAQVSAEIGSLDLGRIHAVAATLIRNVERDIGRASVDEERLGRVTWDITVPTVEADATSSVGTVRDWPSDLDERLAGLSRQDSVLLKRVLIRGETQADAGAALGLAPSAARTRYSRAIKRLSPCPEG